MNNIFKIYKSNSRPVVEYVKFFFKKNKLNSCIDIGAGDGIVSSFFKHYEGFDIGQEIYKASKKVTIVNNFKKILEIKKRKNYDLTILNGVAEHTLEFSLIIKDSMNLKSNFFMFSINNDLQILSRFKYLFFGRLYSLGLENINLKKGHRHLWFINIVLAQKILDKLANENFYQKKYTIYYHSMPKNFLKYYLYKLFIYFLPAHLSCNEFCIIYEIKK